MFFKNIQNFVLVIKKKKSHFSVSTILPAKTENIDEIFL